MILRPGQVYYSKLGRRIEILHLAKLLPAYQSVVVFKTAGRIEVCSEAIFINSYQSEKK